MSSLPPDLSKFYAREQQLTKSQTVARRMFIAAMVILSVLLAWGIWGVK